MYKVTVNKDAMSIEPAEDGFKINEQIFNWDIEEISEGYFHILHNNKSYTAEVIQADRQTHTFLLKINGRQYSVNVKDRFDILLEKMGMTGSSGTKVNNIKAPMPGLILGLKVSEGDAVKPGDTLIVLEAMKMENIIKSPAEAIVKSIKVKKGDSVEKNQVLIEF
jgi:biotin carboxyl carrier protein